MNFIRFSFLLLLAAFAVKQPLCSAENVIGPDTIRVMTYNIHHGNPPSMMKSGAIDLKAAAKVINKYHPDLVALQEVDVNNTRSGIHLNEAKKLGKLTGMHSHFPESDIIKEGNMA